MDAKERAERIVLATRQDRYAKATVLLEFITAQIEDAEQAVLAESMKINDQTSKDCYAEGFRVAREKAKGIAEAFAKRAREHSMYPAFNTNQMELDGKEIAQRIGELAT